LSETLTPYPTTVSKAQQSRLWSKGGENEERNIRPCRFAGRQHIIVL
jgi:hypothetical protein